MSVTPLDGSLILSSQWRAGRSLSVYRITNEKRSSAFLPQIWCQLPVKAVYQKVWSSDSQLSMNHSSRIAFIFFLRTWSCHARRRLHLKKTRWLNQLRKREDFIQVYPILQNLFAKLVQFEVRKNYSKLPSHEQCWSTTMASGTGRTDASPTNWASGLKFSSFERRTLKRKTIGHRFDRHRTKGWQPSPYPNPTDNSAG